MWLAVIVDNLIDQKTELKVDSQKTNKISDSGDLWMLDGICAFELSDWLMVTMDTLCRCNLVGG